MAKPKLILMDEPTLGLFPLMVKLIDGIIAAINGEGVTIVLVGQNTLMGLKLVTKGYVMESGKIVL